MTVKAKQNLKEMKDKKERFGKRKGQSSSEDVRPKKSHSKSSASSYRPLRFQGDQTENVLVVLLVDLPPNLNSKLDRCLGGQEALRPQFILSIPIVKGIILVNVGDYRVYIFTTENWDT